MDKFYKGMFFNNQLSVSVLQTTDMVNKAIEIHNLSPVCAAALGRTLTVCTFMSQGLKNKADKLSVTINGDGLGGKITVCGNGELQMRGYIDNPQVDLPLKTNGKLDVGGVVGKNGRITVIKSMGLKDPYSGSCQLVSGEIAEDFTAYYVFSEQQPTAIALGVKIGTDGKCVGAGGVIIQAFPGASDEALIKGEEIVNSLSKLSTIIEEFGAEHILKEYFGGVEWSEYEPKYQCLCSREYLEKILISLGKEELSDIIEKDGKISVECEFCRTKYQFFKEDVENFFK